MMLHRFFPPRAPCYTESEDLGEEARRGAPAGEATYGATRPVLYCAGVLPWSRGYDCKRLETILEQTRDAGRNFDDWRCVPTPIEAGPPLAHANVPHSALTTANVPHSALTTANVPHSALTTVNVPHSALTAK